ncbi:unnamed protein product, partial [Staurois parvus]
VWLKKDKSPSSSAKKHCIVGWPFINCLPAPCLCTLPGSAQHRDPVPAVSSRHSETPIVGRDLCTRSRSCDWPSVITCKVVSKMSLVTSLLTTCEICE